MIGGPTASGKTSLSIALAQHYDCPILSADSRQFYREMSIGTAKPTTEELSQAEHYFVDSLSIHDSYSVGDYERDSQQLLERIYQTHDHAIMVGGSGLYLRAVAEGVDHFPDVDIAIKSEINSLLETKGIKPLQEEIQRTDPDYAAEVDMDNPHRLIRALGVIRQTGLPFSSFHNKKSKGRPYQCIQIKTELERSVLYDRINTRVDMMVKDGLIEEARKLYPSKGLQSLNTVGYKELFQHFDGEWELDFAIEKIKQHSRNYAKRQITWFNNQGQWHGVNPTDVEAAIALVEELK